MLASDLLDTNFVSIDQEETIGSLIGKLEKCKETCAIIISDKKYLGTINKKQFMTPRIDTQKTKVKKLISHTSTLNGSESLKEISRLMLASDSRLLPVIKNNRIIGVVKIESVISQIKNFLNIKAEEVMTHNPITIYPDEKLSNVFEIMRKNNISRIPVVENDQVVGIISIIDLIEKYSPWSYKKRESSRSNTPNSKTKAATPDKFEIELFKVKDEMTENIIDAVPETSIKEVIDLMIKNNIASVLIAKNKRLLGIITYKDILKKFLKI